MSDVTFLPAHVHLRIRIHKTSSYTGDRFTEKVLACPVSQDDTQSSHLSATLALSAYLRRHPPPHNSPSTPIFRADDGTRWGYGDAMRSLKQALVLANMDYHAYGLHSPRIGERRAPYLIMPGMSYLYVQWGFG